VRINGTESARSMPATSPFHFSDRAMAPPQAASTWNQQPYFGTGRPVRAAGQ
jgi:hypothetical protein